MSPLVQNTSVLYSRTGTTATASSGTAASAIDGSQSTAWATTGNLSTSDFWKVNLGGTLSLGAVVLNYDVGGAAKWPASGTIGISLDDITYTTVASWATGVQAATGANPSNLGVNFEWTPAPAKFLKISSTANANAAGAATVWSMTEFSAWATTPQYRTYPDGASVTPVHYSPVTLVPGLGKRLTAKLAVYVPSFGTGLERAYAFYLGKDPTNCVGFEVFGGSAPHLLNYFNGTLLIDSNWNSVSSTNQLTIFDVEMYFSGSSPPSLLDPNILKVTCTAGSGTTTSNNMLVDTAHDFSLLSQINFMIGQQSGSTQKYVVASYIYGNTILP